LNIRCADFIRGVQNRRQDAINIYQYFVVPESQYSIASLVDQFTTKAVSLLRPALNVLSAVEFDD